MKGTASSDWSRVKVRPELVWWWALMLSGIVISRVGLEMSINDDQIELLRSTVQFRTYLDESDFMAGLVVAVIGHGVLSVGLAAGALFLNEVSKRLDSASSGIR